MTAYRTCGVTIDSFIDLPDLPVCNFRAEVVVRPEKLGRPPSIDPGDDRSRSADTDTMEIVWPRVGCFRITDRTITVRPDQGVDDALLRLYLMGPALGVLLHLRGTLVLHGSAIEMDGGAVSFVGDSGSGKSTLACALHLRGYRVLSDDLAAVARLDGLWQLFAGSSSLKLWPDTVRVLRCREATLERIHHRSEKRSYLAIQAAPPRSMPIRRVYILRFGSSIKIERVAPKQVLSDLIRNGYCRSVVSRSDASSYFLQCSQLARDVSCRYLYRTRHPSTIGQLASAVERDLGSRSVASESNEGHEGVPTHSTSHLASCSAICPTPPEELGN
jgi:hypothetical protein